ncbi:MAG: OmpA family protein [Haliscomenobacter sp.]|nr:OmpA family protein [Haliscomenobacter sp.]
MRAFLVVLLFLAYALMVRWYVICQIKGQCGGTPEAPAVETPVDIRLRTLNLRSGDSILLSGFDHFAFDSASILPRLNANNGQFLDEAAAYLSAHPEINLTITGCFRPSEAGISASIYENIGIARAEQARQLLMRRRIPENRITLDFEAVSDESLSRPLAFTAYPAKDPGDFQKVQFTFTNMTFSDANFAFGSDEFRPGTSFVLYADSVKTYMELHTDKNLTIIGHTDYVGEVKVNLALGLRRAKSALQYFRELGVDPNRVKTDSKGEAEPVATNDTPEGRQKNRRVNFVLD